MNWTDDTEQCAAYVLSLFSSLGDAFVTYAFLVLLFPGMPVWCALLVSLGTCFIQGEMLLSAAQGVFQKENHSSLPLWSRLLTYGGALGWGAFIFVDTLQTLIEFFRFGGGIHIPLGIWSLSLAIAVGSAVGFALLLKELMRVCLKRYQRFSLPIWTALKKSACWKRGMMALLLFFASDVCLLEKQPEQWVQRANWKWMLLYALMTALSVVGVYLCFLPCLQAGPLALLALCGQQWGVPLLGHFLGSAVLMLVFVLPCLLLLNVVNALFCLHEYVDGKEPQQAAVSMPSWVFLVNPVFWVALFIRKIAQGLFFLLHLISEGISGANTLESPSLFLGLLMGIGEALSSIPYVFFGNKEEQSRFMRPLLMFALFPLLLFCSLMHYMLSAQGMTVSKSLDETLGALCLKEPESNLSSISP